MESAATLADSHPEVAFSLAYDAARKAATALLAQHLWEVLPAGMPGCLARRQDRDGASRTAYSQGHRSGGR